MEIGQEAKGFKFETAIHRVGWNCLMEGYIGLIGVVVDKNNHSYKVKFEDGESWWYPLSLQEKGFVNNSEISTMEIGQTVYGFFFNYEESALDEGSKFHFVERMWRYIGKKGLVTRLEEQGKRVRIEFEGGESFIYPTYLVIERSKPLEVGQSVVGFGFESRADGSSRWNNLSMSRFIDQQGVVSGISGHDFEITYPSSEGHTERTNWWYPLSSHYKAVVNEVKLENNLKQIEMKNFIVKLEQPTNGHEKLMTATLLNLLTRVGGVTLTGDCVGSYYGINNNGEAYISIRKLRGATVMTLEEWYNDLFLPSISFTGFYAYNTYNNDTCWDSRVTGSVSENTINVALTNNLEITQEKKWGLFINWMNEILRKQTGRGSVGFSGNSMDNYYYITDSCQYDNTSRERYLPDGLIELNLDSWFEMFIGKTDSSTVFNVNKVELYDGRLVLEKLAALITDEQSEYNGKWVMRAEAVNINEKIYFHTEVTTLASGNKIPSREITENEDDFVQMHDGRYERADNPYVRFGYVNSSKTEGYFFNSSTPTILVTDDGHEVFCISEAVASCFGSWIGERGKYYEYEAYDAEMEEIRGEENNNDYHSGSRDIRFGDNAKYTIGFEIEKEDEDAVEIGWYKLKKRTGWDKERDGSLCSSTGYELVSPAFDLFTSDIDDEINADEDLQTLINADYSDACGGHINLGSTKHSTTQLFQLIEGWLPLFYTLYEGRIHGEYCQAKEKYKYAVDKDKYSAIYVKSSVVEFRIPSAVISVKNLLWRRDLMRIICSSIKEENVKGIEGTIYKGASEIDVLKMLVNPTSELHQHLRKIYSHDRLLNKINRFVTFAGDFNSITLPRIDGSQINNSAQDSTEELGA